ncbi:MAG: MFS transporter, partial [Acidimicrobiia bacterium]|nr:MFS transporter [Acidimicrobiia bacterium]
MAELVKNDRDTIFAWAMYDWANSAYATTSGAIVAPFFTGIMVGDDGASVLGTNLSGTTIWSAVVSIGAIILFLAMPVLGAVADFSAAKRSFLRFFAFVGAAFTTLLFVVPDGSWILFLLVFLVSQIGFVAANVFYDGFLPQIATDDTVDRISSKGFAYGYVGGGLYLLIGLIYILNAGDDGNLPPRFVIAGAGAWWFLFTVWTIRRLP